jgi:hypothetical protein
VSAVLKSGLEIAQELVRNLQTGDALLYAEEDYTAFCEHYAETTKAQRLAYFGSRKAEQMERRFCAEHCVECDSRVSEEEANEAGRESRDPLCEAHRLHVPDECPDMLYVCHWNARVR